MNKVISINFFYFLNDIFLIITLLSIINEVFIFSIYDTRPLLALFPRGSNPKQGFRILFHGKGSHGSPFPVFHKVLNSEFPTLEADICFSHIYNSVRTYTCLLKNPYRIMDIYNYRVLYAKQRNKYINVDIIIPK